MLVGVCLPVLVVPVGLEALEVFVVGLGVGAVNRLIGAGRLGVGLLVVLLTAFGEVVLLLDLVGWGIGLAGLLGLAVNPEVEEGRLGAEAAAAAAGPGGVTTGELGLA